MVNNEESFSKGDLVPSFSVHPGAHKITFCQFSGGRNDCGAELGRTGNNNTNEEEPVDAEERGVHFLQLPLQYS